MRWRDEDGTKLFLKNKRNDGAIPPNERVTLDTLKQLREGDGEPIPETIVIQTKGDNDARLAAKQMVQSVLDQSSQDSNRDINNNPNDIEDDNADNYGNHNSTPTTIGVRCGRWAGLRDGGVW